MKTIKIYFFSLLFLSAFSIPSFCQSDKIIDNSKPSKFLIGQEYSKVSELDDFDSNSSSKRTFANEDMISSANLIKDGKQIITSEKTWFYKNNEIHKILDIIVLNGKYSTCGGCLLPKKKGNTVKSIYPYGTTKDDLIITAFERNRKKGKFNQVNPDKLKRNPNYLANSK